MAGPGFQQIGYLSGSAPLGTAPLGTSPLGGGAYPIYELPPMQPGSNRLTKTDRGFMARHTHKRDGLIIGDRIIGEHYKWTAIFVPIPEEDMQKIVSYARLRRFYLLPDVDVPSQKRIVIWVGPNDLNFPPLVGRYHNVRCDLEQASGPLAVA